MCWCYFKIFIGDFSMQSILRPTVCNLLRQVGIGFSRKMNDCYLKPLKNNPLVNFKEKKTKAKCDCSTNGLTIHRSQLQGRYGN